MVFGGDEHSLWALNALYLHLGWSREPHCHPSQVPRRYGVLLPQLVHCCSNAGGKPGPASLFGGGKKTSSLKIPSSLLLLRFHNPTLSPPKTPQTHNNESVQRYGSRTSPCSCSCSFNPEKNLAKKIENHHKKKLSKTFDTALLSSPHESQPTRQSLTSRAIRQKRLFP